MGELIGRMFVESHFGAEAKARMLELVGNLLKAFDTSIDGLEWMSPATRAEAKKKLSKITVKIGYPDKWRDYSTLTVRSDDLVGNLLRASEFQHQRYVTRTGGPVDKGEWLMTPQTVNAYYNSTTNEITFPAAILRWPFFDVTADDAVNYGGIGSVIGHEISHGFDDSGRQFDGDGNLRDWWTADDGVKFKQRAGELAKQFAGYTVLDNRHHQRRAHARREHRRSVRHGGGVQGVPDLAGWQAALRDRRLHRRAAFLPRLGAGVAPQVSRCRAAQAPGHRSAQPERVSCEWT